MVFVSRLMKIHGEEKTMKELLGDIVRPMTITRYHKSREGHFSIIDKNIPEAVDLYELAPQMFAKEDIEKKGFCFFDFDRKKKYKETYLSQGFEITEETENVVRYSRPYDKKVLDTLCLEPVHFTDDGEALWWGANYRCNENVDKAISSKFSDIVFEVSEYVDGDEVAYYFLKSGKEVKDLHAKKKEQNDKEPDDDQQNLGKSQKIRR